MDVISETVVPTWVMVIVVAVLTASLFAGVPLARAAGRRHGRRLAHPELFTTRSDKAKDTALFLAALVPSILVWLAVMGVSFIGLTGFAADVMKWHHWTNMLVPLSLDGISVSFGAWAFVAVKRGRHPGRAYKIVAGAATMSAVLNFVHGQGVWSVWAGAYLAFLSFAGMAMFHELLDQFMAAYDDEVALKTRYPRFGQRWIYAPISTFAARRTWIVYPAPADMRPTVANALDWHQKVKATRSVRGQHRQLLEQQASLEMQLRLATLRAEVDQTQQALTAAHRKPLPYPQTPNGAERAVTSTAHGAPPTAQSAPQTTPNGAVNGARRTPNGAVNGAERAVTPTAQSAPPTAQSAPPTAQSAPQTTANGTVNGARRGIERDDPALDSDVMAFTEHIMILTREFPNWTEKLPPQRAAMEAIDLDRRKRDGGGFKSSSTIRRVLAAMNRIKESDNPHQTLDRLRALSEENLR
jgi:Protein of unknown function (DUF2637)